MLLDCRSMSNLTAAKHDIAVVVFWFCFISIFLGPSRTSRRTRSGDRRNQPHLRRAQGLDTPARTDANLRRATSAGHCRRDRGLCTEAGHPRYQESREITRKSQERKLKEAYDSDDRIPDFAAKEGTRTVQHAGTGDLCGTRKCRVCYC